MVAKRDGARTDRPAWPGTCLPSVGSLARSAVAAMHAFRAIRPSGCMPDHLPGRIAVAEAIRSRHAVARPAAWRTACQFASRSPARGCTRARPLVHRVACPSAARLRDPGLPSIRWHVRRFPQRVAGCPFPPLRNGRDTGSPPVAGPLPLRRARSAHTPRTPVLQ